MMRRLGLSAVALLCGVSLALAQGAGAPPPVTVARPIVKEIVEDDAFVGRFAAPAEVEVRARVTGFLQKVHFSDGQIVEAGAPLFSIDQRLFLTTLAQAEAQLRVAEASRAFAAEQDERARTLLTRGNIAQATADERREALLTAEGALETARAALAAARIDVEFSEITAPIGGRIGRDLVTPGNLVRENDTVLTTIVSVDPMHFYFDIDERYFLAYARDARVRGMPLQEGSGGLAVRVTLSDGQAFPGQLDFSENRLDAETGTMRVRAIVANPYGALAAGLFGRVNVPGSLPYLGVLIPDAAILADQNRRVVMVVDADGVATPRAVRPGPRIDGYRVIRSGLDGTETIVIEGLLRARPGATVAPELVALPPSAAQ